MLHNSVQSTEHVVLSDVGSRDVTSCDHAIFWFSWPWVFNCIRECLRAQ